MYRSPCVSSHLRLALLVVGLITCQADSLFAHDDPPAPVSFARVRTRDKATIALLQSGLERSATFRQLVADIDASRWLVFIQPGPCPAKEMVGCLLHFVGQFEGSPYVRVLVNRKGRHPDQVLATLAHELQHALEVTQDPAVVDVPSMLAMFKRIGHTRMKTASATLYETEAAREMGDAVLKELQRSVKRTALR